MAIRKRREFIEAVDLRLLASAEIYLDTAFGSYIILVHDKELRSLQYSSYSLEGARTLAHKHIYRLHNSGGCFNTDEQIKSYTEMLKIHLTSDKGSE